MQMGHAIHDSFFRQLFDQSNDLIHSTNLEHIFTYVSPSSTTLLNRSPEELLGKLCYSYIHEEDALRFQQSLDQLIQDEKPFDQQYRYIRKDGSTLWLQSKASLIVMDHIPVGVGFISRDMTHYKAMEENLTQLAYYDSLTGLPNRRLFNDRYVQSLLSAKRYNRKLAILYLDLDNFKLVNDHYGHSVGDGLLKTISARLLHCVRDPDTVCRLGGDEFVILLQQFEHLEDIKKVTQRIHDAINNRFVIQHNEISISCSMGAAYFPQDGLDGNELLDIADAAMYQAKKNSKNYLQL
ncbi:sensor domain-containing protein [Paenibacillus agricola]|uniref:Sensor domain-containing diguanylate cyclase n=1 Tax=Paenibacillus agricola TaxID=2716264 RepID=A0ABX0J1J9_9BACL|nr:sensor domain-containing diguanylate cyclase [Paenibacillus agricola]NHN30140.1 sensor domain-containing diguanylate cyclase [Paenibacillus agricola]